MTLVSVAAERLLCKPTLQLKVMVPSFFIIVNSPWLKDTLWVLRRDEPLVHVSVG